MRRGCRRPPYSQVEWVHGQTGPSECAAAGRQGMLRYQSHEYLILGRIECVLVCPWCKRATAGAVRIGSYSGSWDIAEALQPLRPRWLPTSHRSRKCIEYREIKYWGCRDSRAG